MLGVVKATIAIPYRGGTYPPIELRRLIDSSFRIAWILHQPGPDIAILKRFLSKLGPVVDITQLDIERSAAALAVYQPDGIVAFDDESIRLATALAERLSLPRHAPEVVDLLTNKLRQRQALAALPESGPKVWELPARLADEPLAALSTLVEYPCVVKPVSGSGSRDVHKVVDPAHLIQLVKQLPPESRLIESYLQDSPGWDPHFASFVSVESIVSGRGISHAALTGRFRLAAPFRETGSFIPAMLDEAIVPEILALASGAISTLGIERGCVHTEIKLTPSGPRIIEVNGRLGGMLGFYLHRISGLSLFDTACRLAMGEDLFFDAPFECHGVGYWYAFQPPVDASMVRRIDGVRSLSSLEGVDSVWQSRGSGQDVDWHEGLGGIVVSVLGTVTDHDDLIRIVDRIEATVEIEYD